MYLKIYGDRTSLSLCHLIFCAVSSSSNQTGHPRNPIKFTGGLINDQIYKS